MEIRKDGEAAILYSLHKAAQIDWMAKGSIASKYYNNITKDPPADMMEKPAHGVDSLLWTVQVFEALQVCIFCLLK